MVRHIGGAHESPHRRQILKTKISIELAPDLLENSGAWSLPKEEVSERQAILKKVVIDEVQKVPAIQDADWGLSRMNRFEGKRHLLKA